MTDAAPLTSIPEAPVPPGGGAEWFTGAQGAKLRAALFTPKGAARGSVVLSTGRTEAIEKYFEVIGELLDRGFVVLAQEWRGQGLSHRDAADRLKGHAIGHQAYLDDYRALLTTFESRLPKPWIAVGHSMGGCLTLLALARGEASQFVGAVLSAPMLGIRTPPFAGLMIGLNLLLGKGADYAQPPTADPYVSSFEGNALTSDPKRFARAQALIAANHDLALSAPTWGWIDFAVKATRWLSEKANLAGVTLPVVIISAAKDKLVTDVAQRAAAANLPNGKFVSVPGAEHEILMETDDKRAVFWSEFDAVADKAAPRPAAPAPVKAEPVAKTAPAPKVVAPKTAAPKKATTAKAAPVAVAAPAPVAKAPKVKAAPAPVKAVAKPAAKPPAKPVAKIAPKVAAKAEPKAVPAKAATKPVAKSAAKASPPAKPTVAKVATKAAPKAASKPVVAKTPAKPAAKKVAPKKS